MPSIKNGWWLNLNWLLHLVLILLLLSLHRFNILLIS